jgi:hypothetical protein
VDALEDGTDSGVSETSGFRTQTPGEITQKKTYYIKKKAKNKNQAIFTNFPICNS